MKLEIEVNEQDAACCWANHNEKPLDQTISNMVWRDAGQYRTTFPNSKRAVKAFSEIAPLLEPETVKTLRLALDRLEQLAENEQDGLLIERIQEALKGYPSPKTQLA